MSYIPQLKSSILYTSQNKSANNLSNSVKRLASGKMLPSDNIGNFNQSRLLVSDNKRTKSTISNLYNTIHLLESQDSVLSSNISIITRMDELASLSMDVTKSTQDRANYNLEFAQLKNEIESLKTATFNGKSLAGQNNKVSDGNFENFSNIKVTSGNSLGAWTVSGVAVNILNPNNFEQANDTGSKLLDLNADNGNGAINQTITTEVGKHYHVAFTLAGNSATSTVKTMDLKVNGDTIQSYSFDSSDFTRTNMGFVHKEGKFTADSTSSQITFESTNAFGSSFGATIDNIVVFEGYDVTIDGLGNNVNLENVTVNSIYGSIEDTESAQYEATNLQTALQELTSKRAVLSASIHHLQKQIDLLSQKVVNQENAFEKLEHVDVANETTNLAKQNILLQSTTSMLSQANIINPQIKDLL